MHNEISDYLRMIDDADNAHSPTSRAVYADALIDVLRDIFTDEEIQALAQAKADGRLVMLPCKVGDTVYAIHNIPNSDNKVMVEVQADLFFIVLSTCEGRFGKTVFLSREEAEKVLEGGWK